MKTNDFHMTRHAAARALDMAVTAEEIKAALYSPEVIYDQTDRPGRQVRAGGRIELAVEGRTVVTVLHRTVEEYARGDVAFDIRQARGHA